MAFWGDEFIFDGVPCSQFGLMVYHFGSNGQEDVNFQNGTIIEDRLPARYDALTYGIEQNQPLEYTLVFGANMESMDSRDSIDRYEVEAITAWLTGHQTRKWLTIVQPDMDAFRYKCMISELRLITDGDYPWAFSCKVSCDSPFAYTFQEEYVYRVNGSKDIQFMNRSSYNGFYRPVVEITVHSGQDISIQNTSDHNRLFQFTGLPDSGSLVITVDNKNQTIESSADVNLYPYFNMHFLRLRKGDNNLKITGDVTVKFICEFPVNVGG